MKNLKRLLLGSPSQVAMHRALPEINMNLVMFYVARGLGLVRR